MTWVPGETFMTRLWETVEKFGSALARPLQERRVGDALLENRRKEIIVLAQAEAEAKAITAQGDLRALAIYRAGAESAVPSSSSEKLLAAPSEFALRTERLALAEQLRREINLGRALLATEDELADETGKPPDEYVEPDWFYRWRDYASQTSNQQMHELWGRILAGQIKNPGQYSVRSLEFIKSIDATEASLVEEMSSYVVQDAFIFKPDHTLVGGKNDPAYPVDLDKLIDLQHIGLISGVEISVGGVSFEIPSNSLVSSQFCIHSVPRALILERQTFQATLAVPAYILTKLGKEIFSLCLPRASEEYLSFIAHAYQMQGFDSWIAEAEWIGDSIKTVKIRKAYTGITLPMVHRSG